MNKNIIKIFTKNIVIIFLAVLCAFSINEFAYSYARHNYCKKLTYPDNTFPILFYLNDGADINDFIAEVNNQPLILGYVFPKSKLTSEIKLKNKSFSTDAIIKCGKWANNNTYQIIEGSDLSANYGDKLPTLVCGDKWNKSSIGDTYTIKLKKSDGTEYTKQAYISGKIKKENMIKGIYTSFVEPNQGYIILPDVGLENFVENPYNIVSLTLNTKNLKNGEVTEIQKDLVDYSTRKYIFENAIYTDKNIITKELQTNNYSILLSILISLGFLIIIWFIDKKYRMLNFCLYGFTNLVSYIYYINKKILNIKFTYWDEIDARPIIAYFLKADINKFTTIFTIINVALCLIGIIICYLLLKKKDQTIMQSEKSNNLLTEKNEY